MLPAALTVGAVLRLSVVVIGPVLPLIQHALGLSAAAAAVLTAVPVMCFGVGAFLGPAVVRRFGIDGGLLIAMIVVLLSGIIRVAAGAWVLFLGTVAGGIGVAVANVLLPALVRRDFERRAGYVTGLYTCALALFAALAAVTAVPIVTAAHGSWQAPLLVWAAPAVIPLLVLLPQLRRRHRPDASAAPPRVSLALLRNSTARNLTLFMGLQSIGFYAMASWLPSLLQDAGVSAATAGALLSLATLLGIPTALIIPVLAARLHHQHLIALITTVLTAAGWAGLLIAPTAAPIVWAVLLGVGTGSTFPLALLLIALRATDPAQAPQLSATVQGGGYLIAAGGPFLVGVLHDATAAWVLPLAFLCVVNLAQAVSGWIAGRPAHTKHR